MSGKLILGFFLFFLFLGMQGVLAQQQWHAQHSPMKPVLHFNENDGLADNRVLDLLKDREGILWVATDNGISRFDGTDFANLSKPEGLPSQKVGALSMGGNGEIYAGCSNGGLVVFKKDSIVQRISVPANMVFREMFYSSYYRMLLVGTENGLFILHGKRLLPVDYSKDPTERSIVLSIAGEGANIFFTVLKGKSQGLYKLNLNSMFPEKSTGTKISQWGRFACAIKDGHLYAGEQDTMYTCRVAGDRDLLPVRMESGSFVWRLTPYKEGLIWIGGLGDQRFIGGVWLYDTKSRKVLQSGLPLSHETVNAILYDSVHDVTWFGKDDGLVAFKESPFEYIDFKGKERILDIGLTGDSLLVLTPERILHWDHRSSGGLSGDEDIYGDEGAQGGEGIRGGGSVHGGGGDVQGGGYFHGGGGRMQPILSVQQINAAILKEWTTRMARYPGYMHFFDMSFGLEPDSFIGGGKYLYVQSGKGAISVPDLRSYFPMGIGDFVILKNGNAFSAEKYRPLLFRKTVKNPMDFRVMEDSVLTTWENFKILELNGVVYSASRINGLLVVSDGKSFRVNEQNSVLENSLQDMEPGPFGEVWCLTENNRLHAVAFRGKQPVINKSIDLARCGMVGNSAKWIKFAAGLLFVGTNEGLNAMTAEALESGNPQFSRFWNRQNGYSFITASSPLLNAAGDIVVHTDNEVIVVHPGMADAVGVTLLIQRLVINERKVDITSLANRHLPYSTKQISFVFKGLKFPSARNIRYRYKINDDRWISGNHVSLQSLRPGNYRLMLEINDPETKQIVTKELSFSIAGPFWLSWWFLLLILMIIVAVGYAMFRIRLTVLKKQQDEKTALLVENATLHLRSLQIQMNPHFIFNALSSVQYSILKNDIKVSLYYLSNISSVIRTSLANANKVQIPLDEEIEFLKKYIQIELIRFKEKLNITLTNQCSQSYLQIPPMLVQPIIENAIKHGITPKEGGGTITVTFSRTEASLVIVVKDNGIGREASRKLNSQYTDHYGLEVIEKRLKLLNEQHKTDINGLKIIDLMEGGVAAGTEVVLRLFVV